MSLPVPDPAPSVDHRPSNCRFRLRDEGKAYPRSGCNGCNAIKFGRGPCPHELESHSVLGTILASVEPVTELPHVEPCPFCAEKVIHFKVDTIEGPGGPQFPEREVITVFCPKAHAQIKVIGKLGETRAALSERARLEWNDRKLPADVIELVEAGRTLIEEECVLDETPAGLMPNGDQVAAIGRFNVALDAFASRVEWQETPEHLDAEGNTITLDSRIVIRTSGVAGDGLTGSKGIVVGLGDDGSTISVRLDGEKSVRNFHAGRLALLS